MSPVINDNEAKEILGNLTAPRITMEYMESRIMSEEFIIPDSTPTLTICVITLDNGFHAVGMSAPAALENYNFELGRKYARENAIRDLWGKFGFALREKIYAANSGAALKGIDVPSTPHNGNAQDEQTGKQSSPTPPAATSLNLKK